ncbi:hypothetical protein [Streptomyces sp. NPDC058653]|uniref:hypothetical protein n=1 Tax=Streptomyces sp. NPDC058653 TaxID=3346576 RepID=UPI003647A74C
MRVPLASTVGAPVHDPGTAAPDVPVVITAVPDQAALTDFSILPTTLRLINALRKAGRDVSAEWPTALRALLDYVPVAVGYVDEDLDLPLPDPGFTDRIRAPTARRPKPPRLRRHGTSTLPERTPSSSAHSPCRQQEKSCT